MLGIGAAWNEAFRRSLAICIAGFFVPNLLAEFGVVPQLHESFHFLPGICGAVGLFFASVSLFMGYYHRKWAQAVAFSATALVLPYLATWLSFRIALPSESAGLLQLFAPTALVAVVIFVALLCWHGRLSNLSVEALTAELNEDDYGMPKSFSQRLTYRAFSAIGFILILLILFAALAGRK